jgi:hypothetical protein
LKQTTKQYLLVKQMNNVTNEDCDQLEKKEQQWFKQKVKQNNMETITNN